VSLNLTTAEPLSEEKFRILITKITNITDFNIALLPNNDTRQSKYHARVIFTDDELLAAKMLVSVATAKEGVFVDSGITVSGVELTRVKFVTSYTSTTSSSDVTSYDTGVTSSTNTEGGNLVAKRITLHMIYNGELNMTSFQEIIQEASKVDTSMFHVISLTTAKRDVTYVGVVEFPANEESAINNLVNSANGTGDATPFTSRSVKVTYVVVSDAVTPTSQEPTHSTDTASSTVTMPQKDGDKPHLDAGEIVLIVLGSLVGVAVIIAAAMVFLRHRRRNAAWGAAHLMDNPYHREF